MKLSYKFAIAIVSVAMLSIIILGLIFSLYANTLIRDRLSAQLISVSTLKQNQLNSYIDDSKNNLEAIALDYELIDYMTAYHDSFNSNGESDSVYLEKEELLEDVLATHFSNELTNSRLTSLSVVTVEGVVDLSTIPGEKGKIVSHEKYFINGLNTTYAQQFYISISTRAPALTIGTPIFNNNTLVGVLVGDVDLNGISKIMLERSGLGDTGETILINKNHLLVSESRFIKDIAFKKTIYAEGVKECLAGQSGVKEYADYRNVPIIGYFKWIPEREVCLVTKMDQSEAHRSLRALYYMVIIFGLIAILFSVTTAYILSKIFLKSINNLVEGTERWAKGDFENAVPITSNDEIAELCNAFNNASKEILKSRELEKNYTKDLRTELEKKTADMQKNLAELEESKKASLNIMDDLSETNKHLQDLDKAKTDFLNVASHELKTPLTAISAYLEILDDYKGQFNKEQKQGLDAIKRNSNQLKMLIGNILEISRLDSGRFDLNITEVNVKEKIKLLLDNLKILADNKHIVLKSDCDGVEKINTDAMRFEEILNNLVGNAVKFTDKGSITIKAEFGKDKEKGFVVISVIDTGVGIAEDKMNSLFQKFYQVDATISRKYGGTGLGLSITKKMIELQGGKISVSSVVGKGTTFRFTLPIQPLKKIPATGKSLNGSEAKTTVSSTSEVKADANTDVDTAIAKTAGIKTKVLIETKSSVPKIAKTKPSQTKSNPLKTKSNSKPISKQINRHATKKTHKKKK